VKKQVETAFDLPQVTDDMGPAEKRARQEERRQKLLELR
jgi:hypothetical protein